MFFSQIVKYKSFIENSQHQLKLFKKLNKPIFQKLEILNNLSNTLTRSIDQALIFQQKSKLGHSKYIQEAIDNIGQEFQNLNSDKSIYNQLLEIKFSENAAFLSKQDHEFIDALLFNYEKIQMINRKETEKHIIQSLLFKEQQLAYQFEKNIVANKNDVALTQQDIHSFTVIPQDYLGYMKTVDRFSNKIILSVPDHILLQMIKTSKSSEMRKEFLKVYLSNDNQNSDSIVQLSELRQEIALKSQKDNYFQYIQEQNCNILKEFNLKEIQSYLEKQMEISQKNIEKLLEKDQKIQEILEKLQLDATNLQISDIFFAKQSVNLNSQKIFGLDTRIPFQELYECVNILNNSLDFEVEVTQNSDLFYKLYEKQFEDQQYLDIKSAYKEKKIQELKDLHGQEKMQSILQNQQDFYKECSFDGIINHKSDIDQITIKKNGDIIGVLFLDFLKSDTDPQHATQMRFLTGHHKSQNYEQVPHIYIQTNIVRRKMKNSEQFLEQIMTLDKFQQILHEIGHSLHFIYNRFQSEYQLTANNVKIDEAETSAILYENIIGLLVKDQKIKEMLQDKCPVLHSIYDNKEYQNVNDMFKSFGNLEQIYYSFIDLYVHSDKNFLNKENSQEDKQEILQQYSKDLLKKIYQKYIGDMDDMENLNWHSKINHLCNYPGLYYVYVVAETIQQEQQQLFLEEFKNNNNSISKDMIYKYLMYYNKQLQC